MTRSFKLFALCLALLLPALWGCQSQQSDEEKAKAESAGAQDERTSGEEPSGEETGDQAKNSKAADNDKETTGQTGSETGSETGEEESQKKIAGLVTVASEHDVATTVKNLEGIIDEKGLKLLAKVDHSANAASVDMKLQPTTLLIFGNPKVGTRLMQSQQSVGIDLPMKALVWQHQDGSVHVSYNDPAWLAERHGVEGKDDLLGKMSDALNGIVTSATEK